LVDAYEVDQTRHGIVAAAQSGRLLRRELKSLLDKDPGKLTRTTLVELVHKVQNGTPGHAHPRPGTAHTLRALLHGLFEHAVNTGTLGVNPMAGYRVKRRSRKQRLADAEKKVSRNIMLDMTEVAALWRACSDPRVNSTFGKYIQLLILSGTRRKEQAQARLSWVSPATNERPALLTIPAAHTKSARAHVVPLTPLAVSVINGVQRFRGTDLLTPGAVSKKTGKAAAIAGWSKSWPKVLAAAKDYGLARHVKLHDLRRTFRSHLSRLGVPDRVAEAMLNHAPNDPLIVAYDLHDFMDERVDAAHKWAAEIERALSDTDGGAAVSAPTGAEVVVLRPPMKRRRGTGTKRKGAA
jgi:integrase